MSRPTVIIAGDTYAWTVSSGDYPASDGYALKVTINSANARVNATTATASNGKDWDVTLTAAQSMQLSTPETYYIVEVAESGTDAAIVRHTIFSGTVEVKAHIGNTIVPTDVRSMARKMLDAIEAKAFTILDNGYVSLSVGDRTITFPTFDALLRARDRLRADVKQENDTEAIHQGLEPNKPIRTRFTGIL